MPFGSVLMYRRDTFSIEIHAQFFDIISGSAAVSLPRVVEALTISPGKHIRHQYKPKRAFKQADPNYILVRPVNDL